MEHSEDPLKEVDQIQENLQIKESANPWIQRTQKKTNNSQFSQLVCLSISLSLTI